MTQEEKQLLIKDLCARLPFSVKCNALLKQVDGSLKSIWGTFKGYNGWATVGNNLVDIETVRPYLHPMSSIASLIDAKRFSMMSEVEKIDWYNENHIDYRGLIPMRLAIEAPVGMYKTK